MNFSLAESDLTIRTQNVKNKAEFVIYITEDGLSLIGTKK